MPQEKPDGGGTFESTNGVRNRRQYPELPMVGVGGVVIRDGRALLIRRGSEPLKGEWSIPGGLLELGETIIQGVVRELLEETGLKVQVIELIEVFERIFPSPPQEGAATVGVPAAAEDPRPLYHFVILDYLCEAPEGKPRAGGDVTDVAFGTEEELEQFRLTPAATRVLRKAFELARARAAR